jgi:hypothetical protein
MEEIREKLRYCWSKKTTHQSRQGQAISKSGHRSFEVACLEILVDRLGLHRSVHVCPYQGNGASWYAATFVGNLDGDVLPAFDYHDLDRGEVVLVIGSIPLYDRSKRVLEEFEADVRQVAGDVCECEVSGTDEVDGGTAEHGVVFFVYKASILYCFVDDVVDILDRRTGCESREGGYRWCCTACVHIIPT